MFQKAMVLWLIILVVFAVPCSANVREQLSDLDQERQIFCLLWISGIEQVAKESGDKEALRLLEYFKLNGNLAVAKEDGVQPLKLETSNSNLLVIPLLQSDLSYSYLRPISDSRTVAAYQSSENILYLKPRYYSYRWYGVTGLHELHHAYYLPKGKSLTRDEKIEADLKAYEFEIRLAEKLWGDNFKIAVSFEAARLEYIAKKYNFDLLKNVPLPSLYIEAYDKIFGPAVSDEEKNTRMTVVWMAAYLKLVSKRTDIDMLTSKKNFISSIIK